VLLLVGVGVGGGVGVTLLVTVRETALEVTDGAEARSAVRE